MCPTGLEYKQRATDFMYNDALYDTKLNWIPLYTHPSKELTDAQNTIRQLAEKLECYKRLVDANNMASNPMGIKSREALRNVREMKTIMTTEEEIRQAVEAEREACAKYADTLQLDLVAADIRARGQS
jgi:hypothetical protein